MVSGALEEMSPHGVEPIVTAQSQIRGEAVDGRGAVFRGAAAGREILRRLPGGSVWVLPFHLPGGLAVAERVYAWITRRWGPVPARPPLA